VANISNANTVYIDATGDIAETANARLMYVILTATGASGRIVLENQGGDTKADLRIVTSGDSITFDFTKAPIVFPTGINIDTLSNAVATLVIRAQGIGGGS